jgi:hypothetical protein
MTPSTVTLDLSDTKTAARIEEMAAFLGLRPRDIPGLHVARGGYGAWVDGRCTVYFYDTQQDNRTNHVGISYDGLPQAAYQVALNILRDHGLQAQMGVKLL